MDIRIMDDCCMALETAEAIARYINREDYEATRNKMLTRYGARFTESEKENFIHRMQLVSQANEIVRDSLSSTPEMEYLFHKYYYNNTYSILATIIILNFGDMLICDIDSFMESCLRKWNDIMNKPLHLRGVAYSALIFEKGDVPLKTCLLDDLDALPYPSEFKWNLFKVLSNFEKYVEELKTILLSAEAKMNEALLLLVPVVEEMKHFWEEHLTEELVYELIDSMNLSRANTTGKTAVLQILRMPCDQAIIDDEREDATIPVLLGLAIEWGPQFINEQVDISVLCEEFRTMGEESKFEILQLLKNEGSYGQEIARKLNLDAATVSRHLSALSRYGLIYIERKEKRNIYYKLNQNEIRNLLDSLQRIFLE